MYEYCTVLVGMVWSAILVGMVWFAILVGMRGDGVQSGLVGTGGYLVRFYIWIQDVWRVLMLG